MTSLDGYSLNNKMDKEFEKINEQIEVLKFRIDEEISTIREQFKDLTLVASKKEKLNEPKKANRKG